MKNKTKAQKKRETVQIALDPELKGWLTEEKEAAEDRLGDGAEIKMAVVAKGKLRARMADEKKGI